MPWQPKCAVSVVASRRFERGKSEMQTKTTIVVVAAAYFLCANAVLAHDESTQQKFRRGTKGTYLSETDDWWICTGRQFPGFHAPQAICLFYPFHSQ